MLEGSGESPHEGRPDLQVAAAGAPPCAPEPPTPDLRPPARSLGAAGSNIRSATQAAQSGGGGRQPSAASGTWRVQRTPGGVSICSTESDAGDSCAPSAAEQDIDADEQGSPTEQDLPAAAAEEDEFRGARARHLLGFDLDGLQPDEICDVIDALAQAVRRIRHHVDRRTVAVRNRHRQWPLLPPPAPEGRRNIITWRRPDSPNSSPTSSPMGGQPEPMTFAALKEAMNRLHESPQSPPPLDAGIQHRRGQSLPGLRVGSLAALSSQAARAPSPLGLVPGQALSSSAGSEHGSEHDDTSPRSVSSGGGDDARGRRVAVSRLCSGVVMEELQRRSAVTRLHQDALRHR